MVSRPVFTSLGLGLSLEPRSLGLGLGTSESWSRSWSWNPPVLVSVFVLGLETVEPKFDTLQ